MKTSKVFKLAKNELHKVYDRHPRDELYICWILDALRDVGRISSFDAQRVKVLLSRLLEGRIALENWLRVKRHAPESTFDYWDNRRFLAEKYAEVRRKLYVTRLAWLDHLIAHYEAKGD